ncbi:MAG: RNA polymerase sigma-70 factor, partial [Bacteroidales bacterium]|nr:RNA polymerase sigma-70 factor [Bacteroidales bacterium]
SQPTDKDLVLSLTEHEDENAFCELYIRYHRRLSLFCTSLVKIPETAEDIVQDVFTAVWSRRQTLDPNLSFSSYLYTVARNKTLNFLREAGKSEKVKKQILDSSVSIAEVTDTDLTDREYAQLLEKAVSGLSPLRQKIFRLSREENLSHKEIAQQLNISLYTVQENISAALKHIKKFLTRYIDLNLCLLVIVNHLLEIFKD